MTSGQKLSNNYLSTIFTVKRRTGLSLKITISPTRGEGWLKPRKKKPSFNYSLTQFRLTGVGIWFSSNPVFYVIPKTSKINIKHVVDFFSFLKLQYLEREKKFHILIVYHSVLYEEAILNLSCNIIYILHHKYCQELIKSVNHNINIVTKLYNVHQ